MAQPLSIGSVVHFRIGGDDASPTLRAADVVNVYDVEIVAGVPAVEAIFDGDGDEIAPATAATAALTAPRATLWVKLDRTRDSVRVSAFAGASCGDGQTLTVPNVAEGAAVGTWRWPAKV